MDKAVCLDMQPRVSVPSAVLSGQTRVAGAPWTGSTQPQKKQAGQRGGGSVPPGLLAALPHVGCQKLEAFLLTVSPAAHLGSWPLVFRSFPGYTRPDRGRTVTLQTLRGLNQTL